MEIGEGYTWHQVEMFALETENAKTIISVQGIRWNLLGTAEILSQNSQSSTVKSCMQVKTT